MRIWTVHPRYLDRQGLLALWREALLAQAVLGGRTRGYRRHPQLDRFRIRPDPVAFIAAYLAAVRDEAARRGYAFDGRKIARRRTRSRIVETRGQLLYEWRHLKAKLARRARGLRPDQDPASASALQDCRRPCFAWKVTQGRPGAELGTPGLAPAPRVRIANALFRKVGRGLRPSRPTQPRFGSREPRMHTKRRPRRLGSDW